MEKFNFHPQVLILKISIKTKYNEYILRFDFNLKGEI